MRLPCVVGAGDATARIRTGDLVRVDGTTGTVENLERQRLLERQGETAP